MSSIPSATQPPIDALEQSDPWRNAWQVVSNDLLLAVLCLLTLLTVAAGYILPQIPAAGTADPLAYGQWQTQARAAAGASYDIASTLGLFNIAQAFWFRIVIVSLTVIVVLRLADRVARLMGTRRTGEALRDEERVRVTDQAPPLEEIAAWLRARRYRVVVPASDTAASVNGHGWLAVDRAPLAELFSVVLHAGLLIALVGILLNSILGWDVARQQIDTDTASALQRNSTHLQLQSIDPDQRGAQVRLQDDDRTVGLPLGQPVELYWLRSLPVPCCLGLRLAEVTPGFRVSAIDAAGLPLTITASSYADPAKEVLLTLRRDEPGRLVAVEAASMAVLVTENKGGSVQVYGVPSGKMLTDTVLRPSIVISGTTLQFKPTTSAAVAARYRPGDALLWSGGLLALLGLLAVALWPMQRLIVRRHVHWTEFYASGHGMRHVVRDLLTATRTS